MTAPSLAARLRAGETLLCGWAGLSDPIAAEAMARAGLGAVCLDNQHGFLDFSALRGAITGVVGAGSAPVVRIPIGDFAFLGRVLDMGAEGVICPMVNSRADAERLVEALKFPPLGERSWAPHRVTMLWDMAPADYLSRANAETLGFAMIETGRAVDNLDDILSVEGIDGVFVGPNDLSISLSDGARVDHAADEVWRAAEWIASRAKAHGKHAGIYANTLELIPRCRDMGYRLIASGSDLGFIRTGAAGLAGALAGEG